MEVFDEKSQYSGRDSRNNKV